MSINKKDKIVKNKTCFSLHEEFNLPCLKQSCRCWVESKDDLNCVNIAAKKGPQKQEQIGEYFNLTRMRVCQVEKNVLYTIKTTNTLKKHHSFESDDD